MIGRLPLIAPFLTAVAFLTRLPAGGANHTPDALGRASGLFPLVGALAGLLSVGVFEALRRTTLPPALIAALIVLAGIVLTGALHLDGLADTADGFAGGWTKDDVLRIMRDHQIGTFGALALIVALLLQVVSIAALIERSEARTIHALIAASVTGRWSLVALARWLPYARPGDGLGRSMTDHVTNRELFVATALTVAVVLLAARLADPSSPIRFSACLGLAPISAALVATGLCGWMCQRRIGGITGDTLGAGAVASETLALVVSVACT